MTRWLLLALCMPTLALAGACSGASATADAGDDGAQFASCLELHADKGVMPYAPGVSIMSSGGSYMVTLVTNQPGYPEDNNPPGPEVKGVNTWALQVVDAAQAPVDGVIPMMNGVSPYMPDHGHGTSITPVATGEGSGDYQVAPLYLFMSGYWEITLSMLAPPSGADAGASGPPETVVFKTCIP